jgi:hypothetical protein
MMAPGSIFDDLAPLAQVAVAAGPFFVAALVRLLAGRSRRTDLLLSLATLWLLLNVIIAPYSEPLRRGFYELEGHFR